jgi:hypothetical protein
VQVTEFAESIEEMVWRGETGKIGGDVALTV